MRLGALQSGGPPSVEVGSGDGSSIFSSDSLSLGGSASLEAAITQALTSPDIIRQWSLGLDNFFGVDDAVAPVFVQRELGWLIGAWVIIYLVTSTVSSLYMNQIVDSICIRVAVGAGALYRFIDPLHLMIPRFLTCAYLHLNTWVRARQHLSPFPLSFTSTHEGTTCGR